MALTGISGTAQIRRIFQFSKSLVGVLNESNIQKLTNASIVNFTRHQYFATIKNPLNPRDIGKLVDPDAPRRQQPEKKKRSLTSPEITLLSPEDEVSSVTLEIAEKLSKRRNLRLVKIVDFDTKTERPIYKLMTTSQLFAEETKAKEQQKQNKNSDNKAQKMFSISTKIGNNDLQIKIKQIYKALEKRHEVCIYVMTEGDPPKVDDISTTIQEGLADVASAHRVIKPSHGNLRIKLYPKSEKEKKKAEMKAKTEQNNINKDNNEDPPNKKREKKIKVTKETIETTATS